MIIEEEKVEIIDEPKEKKESNKKNEEKQNIQTSKHIIIPIGIFFLIFLCFVSIIFGIFTFYNYNNNSKISKGIYISNIDVSNLTKKEAKEKLEAYYQDKLSNDITLVHNNYTTYLKTSEIDLSVDIDSAVNYAYQIGKTSNIFTDNYEVFNALINGIEITPTCSFNKQALEEILTNLSAELPDAVVESGYYIDGNELIITKGSNGSIIDVPSTANELEKKILDFSYLNEALELKTIEGTPKEIDIDAIYNEVHTDATDAYYTTDPFVVHPSSNGKDFKISIDDAKELVRTSENECIIPLKVLYPNVTTNMIGQEAFPDLLGTFSTKYTSNADRTTNLRLAANKIDGYVLLPNETFSYNTVVGERTIAAGYKEAAVYENGAVVQGLGGGICQISTTLYNAVLFANLEIVELHNHQFVPSYVKAGRDATVVYGVKDFQFKNSRDYAIKITCSVSNGIAKFDIWGLKQDPEYDVSVYANVTSKTSSYIKSSTYRTLKLNGETINTEKIINSTYKVH